MPPFYNDSGRDFICSLPGDEGMTHCADLAPYRHYGPNGLPVECNATAEPMSDNAPTNSSCVNWNQYYTSCRTSDFNPFMGSVSFDNIGLAWVSIFQVFNYFIIS